jgi:hypothetical protein
MSLGRERLPVIQRRQFDGQRRNAQVVCSHSTRGGLIADIRKKCDMLNTLFKNDSTDLVVEEFETPPLSKRKGLAKAMSRVESPVLSMATLMPLGLSVKGESKIITHELMRDQLAKRRKPKRQ